MAPIKSRSKNLDPDTVGNYLDKLNHHPNLDAANDCPEALKTILSLINRTRVAVEDLDPQPEGQIFNASRTYDKQLIWRAQKLSRVCSAPGMDEKSEFEWQSAMSSHVFLSLNNEHEEETSETRPYHHW